MIPKFIEDWLTKTEERRPRLINRLTLGLSIFLSAGIFALLEYVQIDVLVSPAIALKLAKLLPSAGVLLVGAYIALFLTLREIHKPEPASKKEERPSFERLDPNAEKLLIALSHTTEQAEVSVIVEHSKLPLPIALFHLESMLDLKYVKDLYDHRGRTWSCAKLGRAYLAHHNLIQS